MLYKNCKFCNRYSYSSSEGSTWECPYCGKDITSQETWLASSTEIEKSSENIDNENKDEKDKDKNNKKFKK